MSRLTDDGGARRSASRSVSVSEPTAELAYRTLGPVPRATPRSR
jgi:hypothetical protein